MKKKLKINDIIIVEGRDDETAIKRIADVNIIKLNGFSGLNKKKLDYLKELSKKNNLILFTDPDFSGEKIRAKINENIKDIKHIFISKHEAEKNGNIGVENANDIVLYKLLFPFSTDNKIKKIESNEEKYIFTLDDLLDNELTKTKNSKSRRMFLGEFLNIGYYNSKQLLKMLNNLNISKKEFDDAINKINENEVSKDSTGIIFGKFLPLHLGHVSFIKHVSKYVGKLYVVVCTDSIRDENLYINSKMTKKISIKKRIEFVKEEVKGYKNIEVLHLIEDGIKSYPNGWEEWIDRVSVLLEKNSIKVDVIFTNELQDKANYIKHIKNHIENKTGEKTFSENFKIIMVDPERSGYKISATKIRENLIENKEFLPERVKDFFEIK